MRLSPTETALTIERIEKINARAAKRGFTGRFTVDASAPYTINARNEGGFEVTLVVQDVTITGEAPCYGGYEFLASVEFLTDSAAIVKGAPGADEINHSDLRAGECDHCKVQRANRKRIFIVRNTETGQTLQVGSTCIKDFLGWDGRPVFLSVSDVEGDAFDGFGGFGESAWPLSHVLHAASAAIEAAGWKARSAGPGATADLVADYLHGTGKAGIEARKMLDGKGADVATVEQMIATVKDEFTADNGYEANVLALIEADYVTSKTLGLAVSIVPAYERIMGKRAERAARGEAETVEWKHLGNEGDKVTFTGTVTTALTVDGYAYNSTQRMIVVTGADFIVKMYTAAGWAYDVETGTEITLTGTVKKHDRYQGKPQTVVTRAKEVK